MARKRTGRWSSSGGLMTPGKGEDVGGKNEEERLIS